MPSIELPCGVTVLCDPEDEDYVRSKTWSVYDRQFKHARGEWLDLSRVDSMSWPKKLDRPFVKQTWFDKPPREQRLHRIYLLREIGFRIEPRLRAFSKVVWFRAVNDNRYDVRRENIKWQFRYYDIASKVKYYDSVLEERWKGWYGTGRAPGWGPEV